MVSESIKGNNLKPAMVVPVGPETEDAGMAAMQKEAADAGAELRVVAKIMAETTVQEFIGDYDSAGHWIDGTLTEALRSAQNSSIADSSKPIWFIVVCGTFNCNKLKDFEELP